jgi:hypothetical protein
MPAQRTTWLVTPQVTVAGTDYLGTTPPEALNSMGALLVRIASVLHRQQATEGLVLVDELAAAKLGLSEPATDDGTRQRALDAASGAGFRSTKLGAFTAFFGNQRPTIHVGRAELIAGTAADRDPESWPWEPALHPELTTGLQHWHRLTGVAWQAGPAVMGLELMHRTIAPYRLPDTKGQRKPDLHDDSTPHDAVESMWSAEMWSRGELAPYLHGYDKRRAGITAAGVAKLSPAKLIRRKREFSPKLAGWWHVTVSPWGLGDQLPHPMGPGATDKYRKSMWVTTPTMELCAWLEGLGVFAMPEVIDSLTGPARQVLGPWQKLLESTYGAPADDYDYPEKVRTRVQNAVKVVGTRGIGMLNKADGRSSILRPDWFHGINATKRANGWRKAWEIGNTESRWPAVVADDCMWYASDDADPQRSAPRGLQLGVDMAGGYRIQGTVEQKK